MYLNKLQIFGFKSFADRVSVDFDSGITAIVGPNGCGKTNIVDAVRWAIGEQKASVLRSSTMENVIFSGTKNRKQLSVAEVSLTIENTKSILPSEYTEITITRRCYRDGTSNYFLNGVLCRLKDITSLFMDTGMGSDAYSVIELKMVNEILSHRTQDRRKLFEEAAGITKYKERRRETLYKLEQAKEDLLEANIEIRNRQRTVNAYEKIAQKQQEAREISDKLKMLELDYHTRFMSYLIDDVRNVEEELKSKDEQRENVQLILNANESKVELLKKELYGIEKRLNESRDELTDVNTKVIDAQNSVSMAEQRISYLKENIQRYGKERTDLEKQIDRLEKSVDGLSDNIKMLEQTLGLMEESKKSKASNLNNIEDKVKQSKEKLKILSENHSAIQKDLLEKHNEYKLLNSRLEDQINRSSLLTDENITNINLVSKLDENINDLSVDLSEKKNELRIQNDTLNIQRKEFDDLTLRNNELEKDIMLKSYELEKLQEKINFQKNLLETYEDYSEGVKFLVKDLNNKKAVNVIDKIEVEDKFRIAIETALGEISSYLIVNDLDSMQELVKILEDNNKGKVTFIIKDRLYSMTMNIFQEEFPEILNHQGVYGWADRFIRCPEEYWFLYRYLLDEYVIVEDVETAKKLSKDNFIKFITLDGDIITGSFVRSGGRTNLETMKMSRNKLIEKLSSEIKELELNIDSNRLDLENVKNNLSVLNVEKVSQKVEELKNYITGKENELKQLNYRREQTNNLVENNNLKISELSESNREISSKTDILIKELDNAENIKYENGRELEEFTTAMENLANELTEKRDELNNFNIEVAQVKGEYNTKVNDKTRTLNSIESRRSTIEERSREAKDCETEINSLQEKIGSIMEDGTYSGFTGLLKKLTADKAVIESELNFIRAEYNEKRNVIENLEKEQKENRNIRDALINNIHQGDMKLTRSRIEIKEHKDKIKEDYNVDIEYTFYEDNENYDFNKNKYEIDKQKMRLKQLGGTGQMELSLYEEEKRLLIKLQEEKEDLIKAEQDLISLIEQINITAQKKFTETFEKIKDNFKNIFRELFMEGDEADLRLVSEENSEDPLEAKIDIIAKPRGKRPQLIDLLSGGEKTLTAIALLFAIYQVKPSPFCILDEVDAPLDDANIDRFIKIIRKFSKDTQFIIVTHNKRTMEAADSMYGVTMAEEGISTIVNVKFSEKFAES